MARAKQDRLEARLTPEESDAIAWAAARSGLTKTAFVVRAAMDQAQHLLRDERVTVIAQAHADAFLAWLDQPAEVIPAMKPLADAPVLQHR